MRGSQALGDLTESIHPFLIVACRLLVNIICPAALFLLDNRLEVYLWQMGGAESSAPTWHDERRCAMQTALQYCTGETAGEAKPAVVVGIM